MELREGYKKTEVGVIPDDWEIKKMGNVAPLQRGFDLPNSNLKKGLYPVVYSNGIQNHHHEFQVKAPGVVTGRSGTIGKVTYVKFDFWPHNTSLWVTDFKGNYPLYIYYLYITVNLERFATGSGVPTLNRNDVHSLRVPLPPLKEQQAIATALSDVDALITSLDKLIAKKRNIKQGAMQQLLTGKKRLAGFEGEGEWEVKRLGEIGNVATGNTPPTNDSKNYGDEYFFVSPVDLGFTKYILNTEKKLSKKGFDISRKFPKNSILFTCIGSTIGKSGISTIELTSNQQINAIFPNDNFSSDFLFYCLKQLTPKIKSLAGEQAVPLINKTQFEETLIPLPPTLKEQKAIAKILSDMDAEIETLEKKRDKYKAIKQGMMQELLTGKTRLINEN